jgi:hypothetical protein
MFLRMFLLWTIAMLLFTLYAYFGYMHTHDQMLGVLGAIALYIIGLPILFLFWVIFFKKR